MSWPALYTGQLQRTCTVEKITMASSGEKKNPAATKINDPAGKISNCTTKHKIAYTANQL